MRSIDALQKANPESFEVAKYYVKVHINVPKDGFLLDAKQAFKLFREAERIHEEVLVKKWKYTALITKL